MPLGMLLRSPGLESVFQRAGTTAGQQWGWGAAAQLPPTHLQVVSLKFCLSSGNTILVLVTR